MGSFTTCTIRFWPSASSFSMGTAGWPPWRWPQISATWRNAARSPPISMNADCMPGSTRMTRPMVMLPTRPRAEERSICTSCVTPCSMTATRVSCGVTLTRISSVTAMVPVSSPNRNIELLQELRRFRQRQTHDTGIASGDTGDERSGAALDAIGARLVERLPTRAVAPNIDVGQLPEPHAGNRYLRLHLFFHRDGDRRQHLVFASRQRSQYPRRVLRVFRLADDLAVEHDGGIGGKRRFLRQRPVGNLTDCHRGLRLRDAQHVYARRLVRQRGLVHVRTAPQVLAQQEQLERNADLLQQIAAPRAARGEINALVADAHTP